MERNIFGAIIGDIVGSRFEWHNCKSINFDLFAENCKPTDDTIMTIAVAEWLSTGQELAKLLYKWGNAYPNAGYGGLFRKWLLKGKPEDLKPYNSYGNGSGMRVSPCGFFATSLDEALELAQKSAEITHNHPEGIKGAQAIASAIFLSRAGYEKAEIKLFIERGFGYDLSRTCDEIRPTYNFDVSCQGSCPEAIIAFLESTDYESAIRLAISLGGDSDTIACMTGGMAGAFYGVPANIIEQALPYLDNHQTTAIEKFINICQSRPILRTNLEHR